MKNRSAFVERKTKETAISVKLDIDGKGAGVINSGVPFLDHMLQLWSKHGLFDLELSACGDLAVDGHHTFEDIGLVLGKAIADALGDKAGICRYGNFLLPMDETLVMVALDLSGRPGLYYEVEPVSELVANFDARLFHEFFQALCTAGGINMHIRQLAAGENHHLFEAVFKGFAKALDMATKLDPRTSEIPSTKGIL